MRRTKEEAEETRRNLIRMGVHVFRAKSYAATRLTDIAQAAGVTRGAIYHHFGSKAELFKAMAIEHRNFFSSVVTKELENREEGIVDGLKQVVNQIFCKLVSDEFFRHFMELLIKTDVKKELPEVAEIFGEDRFGAYSFMSELIQRGQNNGEIKKDIDVKAFLVMMTSAIFGVITTYLEQPDKIDLKEEASIITNFIFAGLEK